MNLWLRLLWLVLASRFRPALRLPEDASTLDMRVWPTDIDTALHLNNGRYLTLMDLGRLDLMLRTPLWRAALRHQWTPILSAAKIRFRREIRCWRAFRLETRILCWSEEWLVMEQRFLSRNRHGHEVVAATALVRAGLYDRAAKAFVPVARLMTETGVDAVSPAPPPEVAAFIAAEEALKRAA